MKKLIRIFLILLISTTVVHAQFTEEMARQELEKRGLNEGEVRQKLLERGIDIDNIDPTNPSELQMVEQALREVSVELEQEKKEAALKTEAEAAKKASEEELELTEEEQAKNIAKDAEEISDAVEDGATVEEAISEELIEDQEEALPDAVVFGQEIFRQNGIKLYRKSEDVKPPDDYVLGVGDKVTVSIWGYSQESIVLEVDESGYIKPPEMPRIYLKGIRLGKAKKLLESRFGQYYRFRSQEFEVSVNYSRTINVNIVGEVYNYGSFSIPAINTAFNALIAAGGPSDIGSVRNIKLLRAGEEPKRVDIYEYLLDPSASKNLYLEENDYIHVPVADRLVSVQGAVKRPFKYELIKGENLIKLIEYAGGLKDNALQGNVQIKRFLNDKEIIEDVDYRNLKANGSDYTLLPGDMVTVNVIPETYDNFVEIEGAVKTPGKYEVSNGMKLSDLIKKSALSKDARTDVAFLRRRNLDGTVRYEKVNLEDALQNASSDNIVLLPQDKIIVYSKEAFVDRKSIYIGGAVRSPGEHTYNPDGNLTVGDAIILGGGLKLDAAEYAYIKRTNNNNTKDKSYLRINIKEIVNNSTSNDDIYLEAGDEIYVYSDENFTDKQKVIVSGYVRNPGEYDYNESLTVADVVYFSNGLRSNASEYAYITRLNEKNKKRKEYIKIDLEKALSAPNGPDNIYLQPFDNLIIYSEEDFYQDTYVQIEGQVFEPGQYGYDSKLTLQDVILMSGGLKMEADPSRIDVFRIIIKNGIPTKTVVANLAIDEQFQINKPNFQLEPFDQIYVRTIPNFSLQRSISIVGEVKYPGGYAMIDQNERVRSVIQRSGGLTTEAFPEGAILYRDLEGTGYVVIRLDEVMKNPRSKFNVILKQGDRIEIPKKQDLVTIQGYTLGNSILSGTEEENRLNKINVAYHRGRKAKFYINNFAAGISKYGKKRLITVRHPNGEIRKTRNFGLFKIYPKIRKGSIITVGGEVPEPKLAQEEGKGTDWGKILASTIAQTTAVLSLILLVQRVD